MFTKDEILAQLREGTDAADIAQKMADEINAALDQYKTEQEAAKRGEARRKDAREIVALMSKFFSNYTDGDEMSDDDIDKATDAMLEMIDNMHELQEAIKGLEGLAPATERQPSGKPQVTVKVRSTDADNEALRAFLRTLE
jgi:hypothetical protein